MKLEDCTIGQKITLTLFFIRMQSYQVRVCNEMSKWRMGANTKTDMRLMAELEKFEGRELSKKDEIEAIICYGRAFGMPPAPKKPDFFDLIEEF